MRRAIVNLTLAVVIVAGCAPGGESPGVPTDSPGPTTAIPSSPSQSGRTDPSGTPSVANRLEVVARVELELPAMTMVAMDDAMWVAGQGHAYRIDPSTNTVVQDIELGLGFDGHALAFAAGKLWVSSFEGNAVRSYDLGSGAVIDETSVGGNPDFVLHAHDAIWVGQHRVGTVSRIDPGSSRILNSIKVGEPGRGGPAGMTATPDAVWVAVPNARATVAIDKTGKAELGRYEVEGSAPCGVGFVAERLWVGACFDFPQQLDVVDLATNESAGTIPLEALAIGLLEVEDAVWIPIAREFPPLAGDGRILVVDPTSLEIRDRLAVEAQGPVVLGFGSVWIADPAGVQVLRAQLPRD